MVAHDAIEILTERISGLVRQFGLDTKRHGPSGDRAVASRVDALMNAVRGLQRLVDQRREERAFPLDARDW
ncbi:hypothetical protein TSO221_15855 [Azospirillum sp. TSO22-1]|nr:hypothetical protein TSO221_15855 [Azospirillum sp. TSO22-1]